MKRIVLALVLLLSMPSPAWAGFDEEVAAYKRGDFETALREWRPLAEHNVSSMNLASAVAVALYAWRLVQ